VRRFFLSLLLAIPCALAQPTNAQVEPATGAPILPTVTTTKGMPVVAKWPDGRQAVVRVNRFDPISVPIELQVTENLCTDTASTGVKMDIAIRLDVLDWFWIAHPDTAKIGTPLKFKRGSGEYLSYSSNSLEYFYPGVSQGLQADRMKFQDVKWLPGFDDGKLHPLRIETWTAEIMLPNPETGLNENQVFGGAFGIDAAPIGINEFSIVKMDSVFSALKSNPFPLFGDVIGWQMPQGDGLCQIAFKPELSGIKQMIDAYSAQPRTKWVEFIWESEPYTLVARDFNPFFFKADGLGNAE
jgi:hypothetical protein